MKELFLEIAETYGWEVIEQEIMEDHVHLFLSAPPRYSVAEIVRIYKSLTRNTVFEEFPQIRKAVWGTHLWAEGYFVRAVGDQVTAEAIRRYVRYQKEARDKPKQLKLF